MGQTLIIYKSSEKHTMLKKWAVFSCLVCVVLVVVLMMGCQKAGESDFQQKSFRIGAVLPLTGSLATYGQNARDGAQLAIEQLGAALIDDPDLRIKDISLLVEDSQGQPQTAVSALRKLIDLNKVTVVLGEISSSSTLAMAPIANSASVVLISPAASAPAVSEAGAFVFRTWPSDTFEVTRMSGYIKDIGKKNLAVLAVNNDYGQAMLRNLNMFLTESEVRVVATELFPQDPTDMRSQITKIKSSSAELIYLIGYPGDAVLFLRQYRELGVKLPVIATSSFEDPIVLSQQKGAAEGVVMTSPLPPDPSSTIADEFKESFTKRFGREPGLVADTAYDAVKAVLTAMQARKQTSGTEIRLGLLDIKGLAGASGAITFDENGDIVKPAGLKIVRSGKFEWLER